MTAKRRGIRRRRRLALDALRPLGLLGDSQSDAAGVRSAIDRIDGYAWTSYGGWWSDADGIERRGWVQQRIRKGPTFLLQVFAVLGSAMPTAAPSRSPELAG